MKIIFEKSSSGRKAVELPELDVPMKENSIPESMLRNELDLPEVSEVDVVRHYTALSRKNFGVDNGFYPLGSCTMKYNPKINEDMAVLNGFTQAHPLAPDLNPGCLQLMYELEKDLCEITGMARITLQPAAGSHGELTGVMIIKKYFEVKGEKRTKILIPDSAHGTNPASVTLCSMEAVEIKSNNQGSIDLEDLKKNIDKDVAGLMLTNPNTLGLVDKNILEIAKILHDNGSLFYCDGANLNAVVGISKIADMGFDIVHLNLHKTFSTPHGCGGPGSGPVGVVEKLVDFLPIPLIEKENNEYSLNYNLKNSIGQMRAFFGNFGVMIKAYTYIKALGAEGLRQVAENAVLNANYLMSKLKKHYKLPYDTICKHEFVLSDEGLPNNIITTDIAKRLLDYGFHAPTIYFPLIVHGAIMIEPTETESKQTLDRFADVMIKIKQEAEQNPDRVKNAPSNTPVKRLDAVTAARNPILKWEGKC
ncbi:glycine dehydrogenase (aminomethyl-transferring) [Candidatus Woesearchaeota archaeon]|nr:glycine dehydrogenase (aminomethyl-transferring) [Candidatus Woesearchaeota archaeon]|tara:strand:+ start:1126 stop:2556 length:1431 start_codon:yes stop_codon:yes gene_type:complete